MPRLRAGRRGIKIVWTNLIQISLQDDLARHMAEDRMLRSELAGYKEYAARVRYRLLPGVW